MKIDEIYSYYQTRPEHGGIRHVLWGGEEVVYAFDRGVVGID